MFPEFSNSFLLLIGKEQICPEIVYTKFSNERDARFALRTDICEPGRFERYVQKLPANEKACEHTARLERIYTELTEDYKKQGLELNLCKTVNKAARLEYLGGNDSGRKTGSASGSGEIF